MSNMGTRNVVREEPLRFFSVLGRRIHDGGGELHAIVIRFFSASDIFATPTLSDARPEKNCCSFSVPPDMLALRLRAVPVPSVVIYGSFDALNAVTLSW